MRILLVDDDRDFLDATIALLVEKGHTASSASSVARALEDLASREVDVVFTNVRLPRQSGLELVREVRSKWPRTQVVVVTAPGATDPAIEALKLGAVDYLRKPVRPEQVVRVLDLVGQQLALTRIGAKPIDPAKYAASLAAEGGYEVLLISPTPSRVPSERVSYFPLDPESPYRIRDEVEMFVAPRNHVAVVLAAVDQLLSRHREEEVTALLEAIRIAIAGKGPFAVSYDPAKITATGALAVQASIVSADAHTTIEALSNPIRRLVLRRLAAGPCTFMQAMEAALIDDTSKIAFHLSKLTESDLVAHPEDGPYRLTPRGKGAVKVLASIDELESGKGSGNIIFPDKSPKPV